MPAFLGREMFENICWKNERMLWKSWVLSMHRYQGEKKQNENIWSLSGYPRPKTNTSLWWFKGYLLILLLCIIRALKEETEKQQQMSFPWDFWNLLGHRSLQQPGIWTMSWKSSLALKRPWWPFGCAPRPGVPGKLRAISHTSLSFLSLPPGTGGHLLTITKTEALNCASHPQWKVGSEPWRPEVSRGIWASSFPPCVKNVAGPQMRHRKQTKLANLLPAP